MSSANADVKLDTLKAELSAQGVKVDNVGDLIILLLAEMRSTNSKMAYVLGGGGMAAGITIGSIITLIALH